jgi:hypothetical protein
MFKTCAQPSKCEHQSQRGGFHSKIRLPLPHPSHSGRRNLSHLPNAPLPPLRLERRIMARTRGDGYELPFCCPQTCGHMCCKAGVLMITACTNNRTTVQTALERPPLSWMPASFCSSSWSHNFFGRLGSQLLDTVLLDQVARKMQ